MASNATRGRRTALALERIYARAQSLAPDVPLMIPTYSRFGTDWLLLLQLEAFADWFDALPTNDAPDYSSMTNAALRDELSAMGIIPEPRATKSTLIQALEAAILRAAGEVKA